MPLSAKPLSRQPPIAPASRTPLLQAVVLIVAILYVAREVLVPMALAVLLGFVLAPVTSVLRRVGVPRPVGALVAVAAACSAIVAVGVMLGGQIAPLAEQLPTYRAAIAGKLEGLHELGSLFTRLQELLADVSNAGPSLAPPGAPAPAVVQAASPSPMETLGEVAGVLLHPIATAGIVVILAIFVLLYREDLRDRLIRLAGGHDLHRAMAAMDDAASRLSRYFLAQVALNSAYGAAMTGALWMIGVPSPLLWGFLAGLMRFVPFLGTFIAVAFPALLAIAVDPGWGMLLSVVIVYAIGEGLMGQAIEPLLFGHSTGLSPIAVMIAAVFWTWLWGPIGLVLATPLTACVVVLGRHVEALAFLEIALGNQPPLAAEELFYQRALAGDADALIEQAERSRKDLPMVAYLDSVAVPALRFAQDDARRGSLAADRTASFEDAIATLLDDLGDGDPDPGPAAPAEYAEPGVVLCVPGRGPFDRSAAMILARMLAVRGFGVQVGAEAASGTAPRLVWLCLVEGGIRPSTTLTLLRRLRRTLPGVKLAVFAAAAGRERTVGEALAAEPTPPLLAATLAEAVALSLSEAGPPAPATAAASPELAPA